MNAHDHYREGLDCWGTGDWPGAIHHYRESVRLGNIDANDALGLTLIHTGRLDEAEEALLKVLRMSSREDIKATSRGRLERTYRDLGETSPERLLRRPRPRVRRTVDGYELKRPWGEAWSTTKKAAVGLGVLLGLIGSVLGIIQFFTGAS